MAIDTAQKRMSAMDSDLPWRGVGVDATEAGFGVGNRQAAADLYSGISSGEPVIIVEAVYSFPFISNTGSLMQR